MRMLRGCVFAVAFGVGAAACFQPALEQADVDGETHGADDVDTTTADTEVAEVADEVNLDDVDEVDAAEVMPTGPLAPTGLAATTDRSNDVQLTWFGPGPGFRVYRCEGDPCGGGWVELTGAPVAETSFVDTSAAPAGVPSAPSATASTTLPMVVRVSWAVVVAPEPQVYSYRVTAVDAEVESAPSVSAVGSRARRPVVGYEVQVDGGAWEAVGSMTSWDDEAAGAPTVVVGGVAASQGVFAGHVQLTASGVVANAGASRTYRVRAATDYGPGAASDGASGRRSAGALAIQWHRSVGADEEAFETLGGANGLVVTDTGAPADGSVRYYRVEVRADGAATVTSEAVAGWRQPPPGVPGGVAASSNQADHVRVSWQAVSGAIGYHVYRGETKLTTGTGIVGTSFDDLDAPAPPGEWQAPSGIGASTNLTTGIEVAWTLPVRPVGALTSYRVSAHNAAGEGALSAAASGRRAASAMDGVEVEATPVGGSPRVTTVGATVTSWLDDEAPRAVLIAGTISATEGEHRRFVRLTNVGAEVSAASNASYRVRGRLVGGGFTPWSTAAPGRRAHGVDIQRRWQRSAGAAAEGFADVATVTTATYEDTTASDFGDKHWYRLVVSADGAVSQSVAPVLGWRLAFKKVIAGPPNSALSTDGELWSWDIWSGIPWSIEGPSGGPGRHTNLANVIDFALGEGVGCAIDETKRLFCWGLNGNGQVGDGTAVNRPTPVLVEAISNVTSVGGSSHAMFARTSDGRVYSWGYNGDYSLGINVLDNTVRSTPAVVLMNNGMPLHDGLFLVDGDPYYYSMCAVGSGNSTLRCWGADLGMAATPVVGATNVASASLGPDHQCYSTVQGSVWCWGAGNLGQLGNGSQPTTRVTSPVQAIGIWDANQVSAGGSVTCARRANGRLACWGSNQDGLLGPGVTASLSSVPGEFQGLDEISDVSLGYQACVVRRGDVLCWGAGFTPNVPTAVDFP